MLNGKTQDKEGRKEKSTKEQKARFPESKTKDTKTGHPASITNPKLIPNPGNIHESQLSWTTSKPTQSPASQSLKPEETITIIKYDLLHNSGHRISPSDS
ncbi:unnamed protein product [Lepidochelys kempii]